MKAATGRGSGRRTNRRRVLLCKPAPREALDQALLWCGSDARVDTVPTLAEALDICMERPVDALAVNMFTVTASDLTALTMFRHLRPSQKVVLFCGEEFAPMLAGPLLADACYPVRIARRGDRRPGRVRT